MRHQSTNFGPWTTSLDSGSRLQLSSFWKQRMQRLPGLVSAGRKSWLTVLAMLVLAIGIGLSPLVELVPAAIAEHEVEGDFVAKFSNGVTVELIGVNENPSRDAAWWKPDGSPLSARPYEDVRAFMNSPDSLAREICWRWKGLEGADIQTAYRINPTYNGAGGGLGDELTEEGFEAIAFSLNGAPRTCTIKLSISLPATEWTTQIETQAGYPSSTGKLLSDGQSASVSFMRSRAEGNDTLVVLGYKIPGEVRLAAVDKDGDFHVGKSSGGTSADGFMMREVRFVNLKPEQLKTWKLQTRQRQSQTVEFRNVSLHRGKVTDVEVVNVRKSAPPTEVDRTVVDPTSLQLWSDSAGGDSGKATDAQLLTDFEEPSEEQMAAAVAEARQQAELIAELTKQHGYELRPSELIKHIADPVQGIPGDPPSGKSVRLFQSRRGAPIEWKRSQYQAGTLALALEMVLHLKSHQIEGDPQVLDTPVIGDWVVAWNPLYFRSPTPEEVAAFQQAVNESLSLNLELSWEPRETEVLVMTGHYKFQPIPGRDGEIEALSKRISEQADGTFQFPLRRGLITGAAYNSYPEFLQALGELAGMIVVDETRTRPEKAGFFCNYNGEVIPPSEELTPAMEQKLLESLTQQTGLHFVKAKGSVYKLFVRANE